MEHHLWLLRNLNFCILLCRNADSVYFLRWFYNPDDDDYDELDDTEDDYDDTEGDDDDSYDDMVNIHFDGIPMRRSIPHPRTDLKPNTTKLKVCTVNLIIT